ISGTRTAPPTAPFRATGRLGAEQIARLEDVLARLAGHFRVVLIHHPPGRSLSGRFKRLTDATALRAALARHGAELVLHGHDHVQALDWLVGPRGPIPALGVPAASAAAGEGPHLEPPAYHLSRIERGARRLRVEGR